MVWRCVLGSDRITVSRPGRDAFSNNLGDLLLSLGMNSGQIMEMGLVSMTVNRAANGAFQNATGRYNFTRSYSAAPDIRIRGIENGEIYYPPTGGGGAGGRWTSQITLNTTYVDIKLNAGAGVNQNPNQVMVFLFRKAY